jgi:hypothetical protein
VVRTLYLVSLVLNGLFALFLGGMTLAAFPASLAAFGMPYDQRMDFLGLVLGCQFVLQAAVLLLAARWTRRGEEAGAWLGMLVGVYLVSLTVLSVAQTDTLVAVVWDAPRGLVLLGLGWWVRREDVRPG